MGTRMWLKCYDQKQQQIDNKDYEKVKYSLFFTVLQLREDSLKSQQVVKHN